MNDLTPLFETSQSARTRALLQAGRADLPPAGFSNRLLLGLGLGVAVSSASVTATAGTVSAAAASGVGSGAVSLGLVAKWVAVGVISGGILAGAVDLASSPGGKATQTPSAAKAGGVPVPPPAALPRAASQAAAASPESDPAAPSEIKRPTEPGTVTDDVAVKQGQLGREAQMIDRARRSLAGGNPQQALAELDAFARIAETGVLDREAKVLRIDALYKAGQISRARQLAQEYLRAYPSDAHGARLRALEHDAASR